MGSLLKEGSVSLYEILDCVHEFETQDRPEK
jgi:hypothetical protein